MKKHLWCYVGITTVFICLLLGIFVYRNHLYRNDFSILNSTAATETTTPAQGVGFPIDINKANAAQLDLLPGIGPVLAERIVTYRNTKGPFSAETDIMLVSGIGQAKYDQIAEYIRVGE